MEMHRLYVRLCYVKGWAYKISRHIFQMTNVKINSITDENDSCNENEYKCQ